MAKIDNVNYRVMPQKAKEIRADGVALNFTMTSIYNLVDEMRKDWYGIRYNELLKDFNALIPTINDIDNLVVQQLPNAIETIARNYALVDGASPVGLDLTQHKRIKELAMGTTDSMRFETFEVIATRTKVNQSFENVLTLLNQLSNKINKLITENVWATDSSRQFQIKFTQLKSNISSKIGNIKIQFDKLMNQTLEDMQKTENANTVKN